MEDGNRGWFGWLLVWSGGAVIARFLCQSEVGMLKWFRERRLFRFCDDLCDSVFVVIVVLVVAGVGVSLPKASR